MLKLFQKNLYWKIKNNKMLVAILLLSIATIFIALNMFYSRGQSDEDLSKFITGEYCKIEFNQVSGNEIKGLVYKLKEKSNYFNYSNFLVTSSNRNELNDSALIFRSYVESNGRSDISEKGDNFSYKLIESNDNIIALSEMLILSDGKTVYHLGDLFNINNFNFEIIGIRWSGDSIIPYKSVISCNLPVYQIELYTNTYFSEENIDEIIDIINQENLTNRSILTTSKDIIEIRSKGIKKNMFKSIYTTILYSLVLFGIIEYLVIRSRKFYDVYYQQGISSEVVVVFTIMETIIFSTISYVLSLLIFLLIKMFVSNIDIPLYFSKVYSILSYFIFTFILLFYTLISIKFRIFRKLRKGELQ